MIQGKIKNNNPDKELTKNNILRKISNYDIFKFYTPHSFSLNQSFSSPFRKDKNGSFQIKQSKTSGEIYWLDYANGTSGNCIQYVQNLYNIKFDEALQRINDDFQLSLGSSIIVDPDRYKRIIQKYSQPRVEKDYKRFDVFVKDFTKEELSWWNLRFLSKDELKKGQIYSYKKLLIDGQPISKPELSFAYYFEEQDAWKIYNPLANKKLQEIKWRSNVPFHTLENIQSLKKDKLCVGSKSRKDRLLLMKFLPEVFSSQNESNGAITPENITYIQENSKDCYLYFDSDLPGVEACKYYNQFGFKYINNPKELNCKDPDEIVIKYGLSTLEKLLKDKKII